MINLYDDQKEFVHKIRGAIREGHKSILGVASPAFGKTVVAGYIVSELIKKSNGTAWFLVHRKNLLRQTSSSFWEKKIAHGLMTSGKMRSPHAVQVGTIGTVFRRLEHLDAPSIMFIDEAHLARGRMFEKVILWALENGTIVIGLTGTPERLDGKPLGGVFQVMVESKSPKWLIEQGRLSDYDIFSTPSKPDLSSVKSGSGDYNVTSLEKAMNTSSITGDVISHWLRHAKDLRTVVYCANVKHAKDTAKQFNEAGIGAVSLDASSSESEVKDACMGLASGKYKVITNCELIIEGFDLSAQIGGADVTIESVVLLRPTKSIARYLQMVFRALRRKPTKAVILDHAGCARQHGMPCQDREWSLSGRAPSSRRKQEQEADINIQVCSNCFFTFLSGVKACPHCGAEVEFKERKIVTIEGELERLNREAIEEENKKHRRQEQGQARGIEELVLLGIRRNMKNPAAWAANVYASRQKRRPTSIEFQEASRIYRQAV